MYITLLLAICYQMPIYPTTKEKYKGGYWKKKRGTKYQVSIRTRAIKLHTTVDTEEEAFELLKAKNIEFNLLIKNMIHHVDDHYEVELTQGKRAKFDEEDIHLVQTHTWCAAKSGNMWYATTNIRPRCPKFHNLIMPDAIVRHLNGDTLDNRRVNLSRVNTIHRVDDHYEVELTHGKRAKFDEEDLDLVQSQTWHAHKDCKTWYVRGGIGQTTHSLHQLIMPDAPEHHTVDHINRDGLDNRRSNLRYATHRQQAVNRGIKSTNTSGFTGITKVNGTHWVARWSPVKGKRKTKSFSVAKYGDETAKQMAIAYRQAIIENIPEYQ